MNVVHLLEYKKERDKIPWHRRIGMYMLLGCFLLTGILVISFLCAEWLGLLFMLH